MQSASVPGPLMLDIEGLALSSEDRQLLAHPTVGGLILFSRNYESRDQLAALMQEVRAVRPDIIVAVDQEGGRVQRFKAEFTRLPPMARLGKLADEQGIQQAQTVAREVGWLLANELLVADIDISFAPVLDLDFGLASVIGDRALSASVDTVCDLASALIAGMHEAGMATTAKHFPGHGGVVEDSHLEIPVDRRSVDELRENDIAVFARLASQFDAVMPAHVIYPAVSESPAGFSSQWLSMLRQELGFDGVIFSDDLTMEGASVAGGFAARAEAAMTAGCDMVLVCNHRAGALQVLEYFEDHPWSSHRLPRMMKRKVSDNTWPSLQSTERWMNARQRIETLL